MTQPERVAGWTPLHPTPALSGQLRQLRPAYYTWRHLPPPGLADATTLSRTQPQAKR